MLLTPDDLAALGDAGSFVTKYPGTHLFRQGDPRPLPQGGGEVQEAAGFKVLTLKMLITAMVFIAFMAMGMMPIFGAVVLHFVAAAAVGTWRLESVTRWGEGARGGPPLWCWPLPVRDRLRARRRHHRGAVPDAAVGTAHSLSRRSMAGVTSQRWPRPAPSSASPFEGCDCLR